MAVEVNPAMVSLQTLRAPGQHHRVEETEGGFFIVRAEPETANQFDALVREAMQQAGDEHLALPVAEGGPGYSRVFILPSS